MTILTTSKGRSVDSPFATDLDAAQVLVGSTNGFAQSLVRRLQLGLLMSHDQRVWLHILAVEATRPAGVSRESLPFDRACLLFSAALAKGLKDPRIRLDKLVVKMDRNGKGLIALRTSPTYAIVADVVDSKLVLRPNCSPEERAQLVALNEDSLAVARIYATRTGNCCFCGRDLTTAESVGSGYGPICAEQWGLPWADSEGAVTERMVRRADKIKTELAKQASALGLTMEQVQQLLDSKGTP